MSTDQTTERREDHYCANPRHLARAGLNAPALAAWPTYELCQFRGASRDCIPAVLVPVTQREAEQRVIAGARHLAERRELYCLDHVEQWVDGCIDCAVPRQIHEGLAALAAVRAIPVDTEATNGE